ncbi:MAG: transcriptional repressor NrdR [Gammaproteobacteria bacterium]|nr:MAG: transcriptional repressor NrdR [Gammaproteobacteria bacterium]
MYCPFCGAEDTKVVDSRLSGDGFQIRRRRECTECGERFTTYETAEINLPRVVKRDGSRETFDLDKLRHGMLRALSKRPVPTDQVEEAINRIRGRLLRLGEREIESRRLGDWVMDELHALDHVAYIRYASVYMSFEDVDAFRELIERLEKDLTPEMRRNQMPLIEDDE